MKQAPLHAHISRSSAVVTGGSQSTDSMRATGACTLQVTWHALLVFRLVGNMLACMDVLSVSVTIAKPCSLARQ